MVEIEKEIGKKMNEIPEARNYVISTVHKRHYYLVDDEVAWKLYKSVKGE